MPPILNLFKKDGLIPLLLIKSQGPSIDRLIERHGIIEPGNIGTNAGPVFNSTVVLAWESVISDLMYLAVTAIRKV